MFGRKHTALRTGLWREFSAHMLLGRCARTVALILPSQAGQSERDSFFCDAFETYPRPAARAHRRRGKGRVRDLATAVYAHVVARTRQLYP